MSDEIVLELDENSDEVLELEDDGEDYSAGDHGEVTVSPEEEERLFLEACQKAKEAGL